MTKSTQSSEEPNSRRQAVCLGCGCVCDDLILELDHAGLKDFQPSCELGRGWFELGLSHVENRAYRSDDLNTKAVNDLTAALLKSRSPVLFGLTQCSTETVRSAMELADRARARLILNRKDSDRSKAAAFQNLGRVSSTLGEVKNRSDLVIYWGCDPASTHPRHGRRYSSDAAGRFLPGGRADRTVIVIDSRPNLSSQSADQFLEVNRDRTLEFVTLARLLLQGKPIVDGSSFEEIGLERPVIEAFVDRCRKASYGSLFFQPPREPDAYCRLLWESVSAMIRDLNEVTRFVLLGLGSSGNLPGAEAALTWQSGQLLGVDYRLGFPEALGTDASLDVCLESGDLDLLLVIGDKLPSGLSLLAQENLSKIPCFVIAPRTHWDERIIHEGAIASAQFGIDSGGTATRIDGIVLPVHPVIESSFRSEKSWIDAILGEIEVLSGRSEP